MSTHWSPSNEQARKERFWRNEPPDPTKIHKKNGVPYFRPGHDRVLMPSSFMPVGEHAGKQMQAVPPAYLVWVDDQPWAKNWTPWQPVHDFIDRFIRSDDDTLAAIDFPTPEFYVGPLHQPIDRRDQDQPCFRGGAARLWASPGKAHEDLLHAFAVGCLNLKVTTYNRGHAPHYLLTAGKRFTAVRNGAISV